MFQSNDEIIRVFDDWTRNFCPPNVVKNAKNSQLIAEHCFKKHGILTISGLTEAAHELAAHLDLIPEPKKLTLEEQAAIFQQREFARIQREQLENYVPFSERVAAEKAKRLAEEEAKEQADAEVQINNEILRYECYRGPNRIDHGKSDELRKDLLKIEVRRNGKRDAKLTLEAVRKAISNMP
jgi:hypothetical protein